MNRLLLIDGNAILHRAYHAIPPLTDQEGKPTGAIYGFFSILIKLYHDLKPTSIAVAFDRPAPTFRKKLYKDYQAQRPKMEEDLSSQVARVHEMLEQCEIPVFEMDGYEADDILGTLSRKCQINDVVIVTGDRDLLQLVEDDRVLVFMPTKGISEGKLYGEKDVVERMGVPPRQIADLKALTGDASDNYPGVVGIGPKTAVSLLLTHGSIEKLYEGLKNKGSGGDKGENIPPAVLEKLRTGEKDARLSKELATIRTDVPIEKLELKTIETLDTEEIRGAIARFPSLVKRLSGDITDKNKKNKMDKKEKKDKEKQDDSGEQLSLV